MDIVLEDNHKDCKGIKKGYDIFFLLFWDEDKPHEICTSITLKRLKKLKPEYFPPAGDPPPAAPAIAAAALKRFPVNDLSWEGF